MAWLPVYELNNEARTPVYTASSDVLSCKNKICGSDLAMKLLVAFVLIAQVDGLSHFKFGYKVVPI